MSVPAVASVYGGKLSVVLDKVWPVSSVVSASSCVRCLQRFCDAVGTGKSSNSSVVSASSCVRCLERFCDTVGTGNSPSCAIINSYM